MPYEANLLILFLLASTRPRPNLSPAPVISTAPVLPGWGPPAPGSAPRVWCSPAWGWCSVRGLQPARGFPGRYCAGWSACLWTYCTGFIWNSAGIGQNVVMAINKMFIPCRVCFILETLCLYVGWFIIFRHKIFNLS